jgi:flavin reductase (DIM6/NTAB) family NADH-FMN oxidoreductase RutF
MAVVTLVSDGEPSGCLVGFATQCSIDPPRYLVCLSEKNHTYRAAEAGADRLVVHLLAPDQVELARLFGEQTGDETDKFGRCRWHAGPDGEPVLDDAPAWFSGPIRERMVGGDHVCYRIDIDRAYDDGTARSFLDFHRVSDFDPGHEA